MEQRWIKEAYRNELPDDFHGGTRWQSPSNIALVKYWGKKGKQLPQNPSISFTLSQCRTETSVFYEKSDKFSLDFSFEGKPNEAFRAKIEQFLLEQREFFPFIDQLDLRIQSRNTFPHSSGIASSASSMSALVLCLLDIESAAKGTNAIDRTKASYFSRLASGSACRSVFPKMALWGTTPAMNDSSDDYAVSLENEIAPVFRDFRDSILIVSDAQKTVSSRAGHTLMDTNPYAASRYATAKQNVSLLLDALRTGDLETFIRITESEAMQLHALMMCSEPSFILMKPDTLKIIESLRSFRREMDIPVCFTLDAGPNVHILYPAQYAEMVERFIMDELETYCTGGLWIADGVGDGASRL
ncbi:MAG: diphosphomevalonate decarboxylase [Bacteroidales bacterium]|nr:diphosphomevalonate decarboxylase [Bacteroidales bacterium]